MDVKKCEVCGSRVRVVGNTTKHYEPVAETQLAEAMELLVKLNPFLLNIACESYNEFAGAMNDEVTDFLNKYKQGDK